MVVTRRVSLQTQGDAHIIDITRAITAEVEDSPLRSGIVVIFTSSSTRSLISCQTLFGLSLIPAGR